MIAVSFTPEERTPLREQLLLASTPRMGRLKGLTSSKNMPRRRSLNPRFVLGDFNATMESIDRAPERSEKPRIRNALQEFLHTKKGLVDGWRDTYPDERQFTWWGTNKLRRTNGHGVNGATQELVSIPLLRAIHS